MEFIRRRGFVTEDVEITARPAAIAESLDGRPRKTLAFLKLNEDL